MRLAQVFPDSLWAGGTRASPNMNAVAATGAFVAGAIASLVRSRPTFGLLGSRFGPERALSLQACRRLCLSTYYFPRCTSL
jgi:hypothetical protein